MTNWNLTKTAKKNLSLLADKLDTVPKKYFDMTHYGENLNGASCGCIVHHAALMPRFYKKGLVYDRETECINTGDWILGGVFGKFAEVIGIPEGLGYDISVLKIKNPLTAAKRLRTLVETGVLR